MTTNAMLSRGLLKAAQPMKSADSGLDLEMLSAELFWDIGNGKSTSILRLLRLGADPNAPTDGVYPLGAVLWSLAPRARNAQDAKNALDIFEALLEAGADPNLGVHELLRAAIDLSVHMDEKARSVEYLHHLIEFGADLDKPDKSGCPPLCHAVAKKSLPAVQMLLAGKARVDARDADGNTALHRACLGENPDLVKELLGAGASPNARGQDGATPLHVAAAKGGPKTCALLVAADASLDAADNAGKEPWQRAVSGWAVDFFQALASGRAPNQIEEV